jgi:hypothetical protein
MPALREEVKTHIVQALACYDTPTTVAKSIKETFGLAVLPQQVEAYDPTKVAGRALSQKWRTFFEETRKRYLAEITNIAVAHRAVRLRRLDRMANRAEERGNYPLVAALLEQAAKEMGELYTNRRLLEHAGKDGGPILVEEHIDLSMLSDEQLHALNNIARAIESGKAE